MSLLFCKLFLSASFALTPALEEWENAVLYLSGAQNLEELDADELTRYQEWVEHPLCLNLASTFSLRQSGLMSEYQCAVLEDYRTRVGDILSFEELSRLDGFSVAYVQALRPFVSLESFALVAHSSQERPRIRNEAVFRGSHSSSSLFSMAGKYRFSWGENIVVGVGTQASIKPLAGAGTSGRTAVSWDPYSMHISMSGSGKKYIEKWVVGDFNARFNQGLCLWSGFSLSGFSSLTSFLRKPTGLVPYWSYSQTASLRGAGLSVSVKDWSFSALLNLSGLLKTGRLTEEEAVYVDVKRRTRSGYYAVTGGIYPQGGRVSLAAHHCFYGWDVFGEACLDIGTQVRPAVVAGVSAPVMDELRMAASLRYYHPNFPSERSGAARSGTRCANEAGVALGLQYGSLSFTFDACMHPESREKTKRYTGQIKSSVSYSHTFWEQLQVRGRANLRLRNYDEKQKYDLRVDGTWKRSVFRLVGGLSLCHSEQWGILGYCEQGLVFPWGSFYLKECLFSAERWSDRLYLYEREAPGAFSVPAYYGKGWSASFYAMGRIARAWKLYVKGDCRFLTYKQEKKASYGIKLQLSFSF